MLLVIAGGLCAIGVVMVFSASSVAAYTNYNDAAYYLKKEVLWIASGAALAALAARFDYGRLRRLAPWLLLLALALLAGVLVPHLGLAQGGARRWYQFGSFTFQPSEFAKIALVIFIANLLADREDGARSFGKAFFPVALWVGLAFVLVLREPDFGTAMLLLITAFVMLFVGGARLIHLFTGALIAIPTLLAVVYSTPYRRARFLAFLNPWRDPQGTGYHILQSLYALGSGGIFGLGLGESRQKFGYLPEQYTDFIYAIIGEELGFVGAALVLMLFLLLAYRGIVIALRAEDRFGFFLAIGITTTLVAQAMVNIGVVTSSWPVTGIPLPFVSYGGSSLVMSLFGVGLLASVSRGRSRAALVAEQRDRERRRADSNHRWRHGRSSVSGAVAGLRAHFSVR